jgi:hypothetical protein
MLHAVFGYIDEHGDTDTWLEELFESKDQAEACCKYLNLTKSQKNVEYSVSEIAGFNTEDWVAKLKALENQMWRQSYFQNIRWTKECFD